MNFSKKNHEHKKRNIFFVSKNYDHFFPRTTFTLLAFFMFLGVTLFNACEKPVDRSDGVTQQDIELMKENHIIDLKDAVKAYGKYSKQRVKILKDTLKKKYGADFRDTRNVWFDIKTIKAYIKYIEDNTSEAEGLQFYFSVNPDNDRKQKNHQTFFIAPSMKNVIDGDTIQSGYTIEGGKIIFLYEAFKKFSESKQTSVQKASFFSTLQEDDGFLLNAGTLGPPNGNN